MAGVWKNALRTLWGTSVGGSVGGYVGGTSAVCRRQVGGSVGGTKFRQENDRDFA